MRRSPSRHTAPHNTRYSSYPNRFFAGVLFTGRTGCTPATFSAAGVFGFAAAAGAGVVTAASPFLGLSAASPLLAAHQDRVVLCSAPLSPPRSAWSPAPGAAGLALVRCHPQPLPTPIASTPILPEHKPALVAVGCFTLCPIDRPIVLTCATLAMPSSHLRPLSLRPAVELLRFLPSVSTVASQALPAASFIVGRCVFSLRSIRCTSSAISVGVCGATLSSVGGS
jgi:hypothetical protein